MVLWLVWSTYVVLRGWPIWDPWRAGAGARATVMAAQRRRARASSFAAGGANPGIVHSPRGWHPLWGLNAPNCLGNCSRQPRGDASPAPLPASTSELLSLEPRL